MAVKVFTTDNQHPDGIEHEEGDLIDIQEGHLRVSIGAELAGTGTIAIYAPGAWTRAEVVR